MPKAPGRWGLITDPIDFEPVECVDYTGLIRQSIREAEDAPYYVWLRKPSKWRRLWDRWFGPRFRSCTRPQTPSPEWCTERLKRNSFVWAQQHPYRR
jgi:hypothetical protein